MCLCCMYMCMTCVCMYICCVCAMYVNVIRVYMWCACAVCVCVYVWYVCAVCMCVLQGSGEKSTAPSILEGMFVTEFEVKSSSRSSSFTENPKHGPNSAKAWFAVVTLEDWANLIVHQDWFLGDPGSVCGRESVSNYDLMGEEGLLVIDPVKTACLQDMQTNFKPFEGRKPLLHGQSCVQTHTSSCTAFVCIPACEHLCVYT